MYILYLFTYISELNISKPQSIVLSQFIHTEEGLTIFLYGYVKNLIW